MSQSEAEGSVDIESQLDHLLLYHIRHKSQNIGLFPEPTPSLGHNNLQLLEYQHHGKINMKIRPINQLLKSWLMLTENLNAHIV